MLAESRYHQRGAALLPAEVVNVAIS